MVLEQILNPKSLSTFEIARDPLDEPKEMKILRRSLSLYIVRYDIRANLKQFFLCVGMYCTNENIMFVTIVATQLIKRLKRK